MGLLPDKPNPRRRSIASPDATLKTRRCTWCLVRKPDTEFRWLWTNIRKASRCKSCEKARKTSLSQPTFGEFTLARRASDAPVVPITTPLSKRGTRVKDLPWP